jgi:hypothetical protein
MRITLTFLIVLLTLGGALAQPTRGAVKRDGSSIERAVVLKSPEGSMGAVESERGWLTERYPGWRKVRQALLGRDGRRYDRIIIESPSGEQRSIYFDITDAFGL